MKQEYLGELIHIMTFENKFFEIKKKFPQDKTFKNQEDRKGK